METHGHSHTYSCNICGKKFSRPDKKKRHEESRNYSITCPVGDQYFNRKESMLVTELCTKDLK
jgi:NAD-dependent SIR2 family protein deacetylase